MRSIRKCCDSSKGSTSVVYHMTLARAEAKEQAAGYKRWSKGQPPPSSSRDLRCRPRFWPALPTLRTKAATTMVYALG